MSERKIDSPTVLDELTRLNANVEKLEHCLKVLKYRGLNSEAAGIEAELETAKRDRDWIEASIVRASKATV